jgi:dTDP-4-amino-4,6-dideoxygalactose transaminase
MTPPGFTHGWYRFYAFVRPEQLAPDWSRDRIIEAISEAGVPCFHGSASEVYLERAFDGTGWRPPQRLAAARELGETAICFLTHPTLTSDEVHKTCQIIDMVMAQARRKSVQACRSTPQSS